MSVSTWVETVPSGTSPVGNFPTWAKTMWTAVATGMALEHYYTGSGGGSAASSGDLAPGGSRAFYDVQSNSSAPNSQMTGRLFYASDASRLFVYDSTGTYLVGTASGVEFVVNPPVFRGYWARQSGSFTTTATSGVTDIVFPVPFFTIPNIAQTVNGAGGSNTIFLGIVASQTSQSQFRSVWSALAAPGSFTVVWEALGAISSASY